MKIASKGGCNLLIFLTHCCITGQLPFCGPNLLPCLFLFLKMLSDNISHSALEEEWCFLVVGVKLSIHEDIAIEVLLCIVTKNLIFSHNSLVHIGNEMEIFIGRVSVSVDFV